MNICLFETAFMLRTFRNNRNVKYNMHTELCFCFRSSFSDVAAKFGKDERFKAIEKMRERESIFNDHLSDLRKKEKEERTLQKEKVRAYL